MRIGTSCMHFACAIFVTGMGLQSAIADTYNSVLILRTAGGQVIGSATDDADGAAHGLVWLADGSLLDLTNMMSPLGYSNAGAGATNGTEQVGSAYNTATNSSHAVIWSGSAGLVADLNPAAGFEVATKAEGISPDGLQQVGDGYGSATNYAGHALLWNGMANSVVDLHPSTKFDRSFALGTDGTHQVGWGGVPNSMNYNSHALLWSGTAASAIDLHPDSGLFKESYAYGVSGNQQVGYGQTFAQYNPSHALLWYGTAASAIDLNPTGYKSSTAYSTNGTNQVGYGFDANYNAHALLWADSAYSAVDLAALLPADDTWAFSIAYDITAAGDIYGWAYGTVNGTTGSYAIEWSPTTVSPIGPEVALRIRLRCCTN